MRPLVSYALAAALAAGTTGGPPTLAPASSTPATSGIAPSSGGARTSSVADPARPVDARSDALPAPVVAALAGVVAVRTHATIAVPVWSGGRFRSAPVEGLGAGSGVVVSRQGLILTNAHVVAGSAEVEVSFTGGATRRARVISIDEASDLALLRAADSAELQPIPFAPSLPPPGSGVYVLGNRGDEGAEIAWARLGPHVRMRVGARPLEFWSEVQAPIGPGNSGGALLDGEGRLLGIPSLLVSYTAAAEQEAPRENGFFIPAAHARRSLRRMMRSVPAAWPFLGVLLEDSLLASAYGVPWDDRAGARVRSVLEASPAEEAGFAPGDRIAAIDGRAIVSGFDALDAVLDLEPGTKAVIEVERAGARLTLEVTPVVRPRDPRPSGADDFALHTGMLVSLKTADARPPRTTIAFAGMSPRTRRAMPEFEVSLFSEGPVLSWVQPGRYLLAGSSRRARVASEADLAGIVPDCFIGEQFVAMAHWIFDGRKTVDRAHISRKVYPVIL